MVRTRWIVLVPVKPAHLAKSRLRGAVPAGRHEDLVRAMALDTIGAAVEVARVVVVTGDEPLRRALAGLDVTVLPDPGRLNDALSRSAIAVGARVNALRRHDAVEPGRRPLGRGHLVGARRRALSPGFAVGPAGPALAPGHDVVARDCVAGPEHGIAALLADLPALRPAELRDALDTAATLATQTFLPDRAGTGTTLLAAPAGCAFTPRFGVGSARAHEVLAKRLIEPPGGWPGLRTDVDTADDLRRAAALGVGKRTAAVLGRDVG
jgi:2-phospho-L-lactate guanylyltransferase